MNRNLKNIIIVFVIGTLIFIAGSGFFDKFQYDSLNDFLTDFAFYQLYAFVLGFSNMTFFNYLQRRKWEQGSGNKRLLIGIIGSFIISMLGLFLLRMATAVFYQGISFSEYLDNERLENFYFGIWATSSVIIVFHIIYYYNRYQKNKVQESQIVAKNQTAKFESLKNQLDPHFLFNSLNVLTSLIGENPYQAEKFTTKLS
ncbi:histidine kinase, partial [Lutimonas sp.]|uniref:histidine kinase n=1 Tax=Lutimonas sp. TaxID=1872403 RepID=UPI003C74F3AA